MPFRFLGVLPAALALAACAQQAGPPEGPPAPPAPVIAPGECDAAAAQFAVGQVPSAQLVAEAQKRSGAKQVRVIRPGDMVTMDFSTHRLNLDLDANGRVIRVRCG